MNSVVEYDVAAAYLLVVLTGLALIIVLTGPVIFRYRVVLTEWDLARMAFTRRGAERLVNKICGRLASGEEVTVEVVYRRWPWERWRQVT